MSVTHQVRFLTALHKQLNTPYVWGGSAPGGFDCSGLVYWAAKMAGIQNVPRTSEEQWQFGKPVPMKGLKPGDLVFSEPGPGGPGHVGIYIGHGQIESAPHTGAVVHISTMAQFGTLMGARRILANPQGQVIPASHYKSGNPGAQGMPQMQQPGQPQLPNLPLVQPHFQNQALNPQQAFSSAMPNLDSQVASVDPQPAAAAPLSHPALQHLDVNPLDQVNQHLQALTNRVGA